MGKKVGLAEKLLKKFDDITNNPETAPCCFVGFDGFTDEILKAVDTRSSQEAFKPMDKMAQFGTRIVEAAGKSCNIELVRKQTKIGGNAPILTNALLEGGHRITFVGAIGIVDEIEPLFQEMACCCEKVIALCPSAHSDAIEFDDGKVILGKLDTLIDVNYETILKHIDKTTLTELLDQMDLLICANWTMLSKMTDIWHHLAKEIVPEFKIEKKRLMFVDLADPAKRTDEDIQNCIQALADLNQTYDVILGLNEAEASRIAKVLCVSTEVSKIRKKSGLSQIVIHGTNFAVSSTSDEIDRVDGPYTPKPMLTTGAGDNFNAGFCNGLLYQLSNEEALLSGVVTSGYYVRHGISPTMSELAQFLKDWEEKCLT